MTAYPFTAPNDALDDVLLPREVDYDDGEDSQHDAGHHRTHFDTAVAAAEVLDQHRDGFVLVDVQYQRGQKVVVPYPHGLEYADGDHGGLEQREHDLEIGLHGVAAVYHRGLLDLDGHAAHEAAEHEHGEARAEAQVHEPEHPGRVEAQGVEAEEVYPHAVGKGGEGEHDHLEGHDHGEGAEQIERLGDPALDPGDVPGEHGAEEQYGRDGAHGYEQRIAEAGKEAAGGYGVHIVVEPREGLGVRQLKGGRGADCGLDLQRIHEHHEYGVHVDDANDGHHDAPYEVGTSIGLSHCCTSFLRVARSWMSEMATTIRQKMTALAWPMPRHCGPERP